MWCYSIADHFAYTKNEAKNLSGDSSQDLNYTQLSLKNFSDSIKLVHRLRLGFIILNGTLN